MILWFVILLTTEEGVGTHTVMAAVQPGRLGALGIWKELPGEMRQLVGLRGNTPFCTDGCIITAAVNIKRDVACISAEGVGGGGGGGPRCMTHPKYPLVLVPAPEITRCTPRGAPEATNQTELLCFYISYALFEPRGKSERNGSCIFRPEHIKNRCVARSDTHSQKH